MNELDFGLGKSQCEAVKKIIDCWKLAYPLCSLWQWRKCQAKIKKLRLLCSSLNVFSLIITFSLFLSRSGDVTPPINYNGFKATVEFLPKKQRSNARNQDDEDYEDDDEEDEATSTSGKRGGRRRGGSGESKRKGTDIKASKETNIWQFLTYSQFPWEFYMMQVFSLFFIYSDSTTY